MSAKNKALLSSFLRVLGATVLAAYLEIGKKPLDLTLNDAENFFNSLIAALALTAFNFFRSGETRFGTNARDSGMGVADPVQAGGKVAVETPEGEIVKVALEDAANAAGAPDAEVPVQTDNGPKDDDEFIEPVETFQGVMR